MMCSRVFSLTFATLVMFCSDLALAQWRFDCGKADSPIAEGYSHLTSGDQYNASRRYGWVSGDTESVEFGEHENRTDLNGDAVRCADDLTFRADVPNGAYRVRLTLGDLTKALGSIDVYFNDRLVGEHVAAWRPGSYRGFDLEPAGWWVTVRATVDVTDGVIRITMKKNQTFHDEQLAEQKTWETPFARWYHRKPVRTEPPYSFIGYPFAGNSVMSIEIVPHEPGPVIGNSDQLRLVDDIDSPALKAAIKKYNQRDFSGAVEAIERVSEAEAQVAKAVVSLWLCGRLEVEKERTLVPEAAGILRRHVLQNPGETRLDEILSDAEVFLRGWKIHSERGLPETNHFIENNKAIGWWWTIQKDSPLYWKTRLHIGRAGHMLAPYFPCIGTVGDIFKELEKEFPDNRFVKYRLHGPGIFHGNVPGHFGDWEPHGDGTDFYDWVMEDYEAKAEGAPPWVQSLYPAYAWLVDLSEWWIRFRQTPDGGVGGGTGDDVEIVGLYGYMGYTSRGVSDLCVRGTHNLVNGVWHSGAVDRERGFCKPMADAEHSAEWTGNTLGMMVQIDYGNPTWIERSMKTAVLMRDLWTGINDKGRRQFKSNFFGATQIGSGDRANDSWINYRAVRPAHAVLWYNQNPTVSRLFVELAENWLAAAMATDRGKPKGVIPAQLSWPDVTVGGTNSPNWWTASHPAGTVNYDFAHQQYKEYIHQLLITAYQQTGESRFLEPIELEYNLAVQNGFAPDPMDNPRGRGRPQRGPGAGRPGSDRWVAATIQGVGKWLEAKRMLEGRKGKIAPIRTKEEIIAESNHVNFNLKNRWPIMTTEAGPTDRVAFHGIVDPFTIYTGGGMGGPLLRAAVTYENTTKDFAAAVMAADSQGLRILYYSLAEEARNIGIVPWELESGGTYDLKLGIDKNDDDETDTVVLQRSFVFHQPGSVVYVTVEPRTAYIIEIEQTQRGRKPGLAPDPGISSEDIDYVDGKLVVHVHNVGSLPSENIVVEAYDGDPDADGTLIGKVVIDSIEAPNDLEPRIKTASFDWFPPDSGCDVYVLIDPDDKIENEITTFNNQAHAQLPRSKRPRPRQLIKPEEMIKASGRGPRRGER